MAEKGGIWRTVGGRRIYIKTGQKLDEAMREIGKFPSKSKGEPIHDFGEAYKEYSGKPDKAINKLIEAKSGHVPSAVIKDGVGGIDFVWGKGGKDGYGLAHIIERRNNQGVDGEKFVRKIPKLLKNGAILRSKHEDRVYISDHKETAVIRLDYDGKKAAWLVTAYIKE